MKAHASADLIVRLASDDADLRAAQRLRYLVFVEEMGGDGPLVDHEARLECDALDPFFDHLLLIDPSRDPAQAEHVVGAYRLLPGDRLDRAGQFYCADEFDLSPLLQSGRRLLELGRSCIDPEWRGGPGMLLLWQGLARYVQDTAVEVLFGAASFRGTDLTLLAEPLALLHCDYLAPPDLRVRARQPEGLALPAFGAIDRARAMAQMPPLIRAYLRLGGCIGEGVFIDRAFNTTDICLILDTARLGPLARSLTSQPRA